MMQVAITVLAGLLLGHFSRSSGSFPDAIRWAGNSGAWWLAVAFLVGHRCRTVRGGAVAGATSLAVAATVHYVPFRLMREEIGFDVLRYPLGLWVAVGIVVGGCFGALGAAHGRGYGRAMTWGSALLAASFAAEAIVLLLVAHPNAVAIAVPIEFVCAIVVPLVLVRTARQRVLAYGAALLLIPIAMTGLATMMGVIQRVYPGV
jgi:hypothetical protein